jgi:hypothetical protein
MSPTPWTYNANGDHPEEDGYVVIDRDGAGVAIVDTEEDAIFICDATKKEQ